MGKFFTKTKNWFKAHKPTKRRLIQLYTALLYNCNIRGFTTGQIYKGNAKYACVPGLNCYSCPGAVGSCPLGALQNAMGSSDARAPVYMLGIIALFGLLLGRTICGFLCPMGLIQDLLYKIKTPKLKKNSVTRVLSYLKYVLLVVMVIAIPLIYSLGSKMPLPAFCKYICPSGTLIGAISLLAHPENAEMYTMLGELFTWKFSVLVVILVSAIFIYRSFCRFICPLGAIYGLFNKIALLGVRLDKASCTDCGLCVATCKMDIKHVGDQECINCGACISVCPTKAISWKGSKIFLKGSEASPPPEPQKPLNALIKRSEEDGFIQITESPLSSLVKAEEAPVKPAKTRKNNVKRRNIVLQVFAWIAALAVLGGAVYYFNFVDVQETPSEQQSAVVGSICPDFTVTLFGRDENGFVTAPEQEFIMSENLGKVTVVNFWGLWCTPCVNELPYFEQLQRRYPEIQVIAVHSVASKQGAPDYINEKQCPVNNCLWKDYTLTFAQDTGTVYDSLSGGGSTWPMTYVLDKDGTVTAIRVDKLDLEILESLILPLL